MHQPGRHCPVWRSIISALWYVLFPLVGAPDGSAANDTWSPVPATARPDSTIPPPQSHAPRRKSPGIVVNQRRRSGFLSTHQPLAGGHAPVENWSRLRIVSYPDVMACPWHERLGTTNPRVSATTPNRKQQHPPTAAFLFPIFRSPGSASSGSANWLLLRARGIPQWKTLKAGSDQLAVRFESAPARENHVVAYSGDKPWGPRPECLPDAPDGLTHARQLVLRARAWTAILRRQQPCSPTEARVRGHPRAHDAPVGCCWAHAPFPQTRRHQSHRCNRRHLSSAAAPRLPRCCQPSHGGAVKASPNERWRVCGPPIHAHAPAALVDDLTRA